MENNKIARVEDKSFVAVVKKQAGLLGKEIVKESPLILIGFGVVGLGATAILAYKARPKVEKIVDSIEEKREKCEEVDIVEVGKDLTKALAIPVTVGLLSAGAIIWSYRIQTNRIVTLAGVLAATQQAQQAFETKFKKKYGEQAYNEFLTTDEVVTEGVDDEGNKVEVVENVRREIDGTIGEWYDQSEHYASDNHSYNLQYIQSVAETMDNRLFTKGFLYLNELREALGFERTRSGALLGWSSSDYFHVDAVPHIVEDPVTGERKTEIFVTWKEAKYIYKNAELGD